MTDSVTATRPVEKLAYSVNETIAALGVKRTALYQLIDSGQLRTVKAGGRRLVPLSSIVSFLEGGDHVTA